MSREIGIGHGFTRGRLVDYRQPLRMSLKLGLLGFILCSILMGVASRYSFGNSCLSGF